MKKRESQCWKQERQKANSKAGIREELDRARLKEERCGQSLYCIAPSPTPSEGVLRWNRYRLLIETSEGNFNGFRKEPERNSAKIAYAPNEEAMKC